MTKDVLKQDIAILFAKHLAVAMNPLTEDKAWLDNWELLREQTWKLLSQALQKQDEEWVGRVWKLCESMKLQRLDSPRSFGDGDVVNVAPGYNQAIVDIQGKLSDLQEKVKGNSEII